MDDFEWASSQYEAIGYVLLVFMMDCDCYHWKAVYVRADQLESAVQKGVLGDWKQQKPRG
jgi:hypothetical protein